MKSKYPQRYEPGELHETRRRLGDLSEAEAKKYADMLGGEIGVEKGGGFGVREDGTAAPPEAPAEKGPRAGMQNVSGGGEAGPRFVSSPLRRGPKVPYFERVKIDFLCASPEHRLKTTKNAALSLLRFLFPGRDYVNPFFLTHAEEIFYTNIENLVTAVRALLAIASYTGVLPRVWAYYRELLNCVARWNIEGMNLDIIRLQQHPKRKHMKTLRSLVRNVYVPFVRLSQAVETADLFRALHRVYTELRKLGITAGKQERVATYYRVAKAELPVVFGRIQKTLYPLLLKVCDTGFISYEELFSSRIEDISRPLMVRDDQIVGKENYPKEPEESGQQEAEEGEEDVSVFLLSPRYGGSQLFAGGSKLIEALFPRCGWNNPAGFVDFFAYFSPILPYPKGAELIAPESALMRVLTLLLIIQELLPGFRGIDFGIIRDADENPIGLQYEMAGILGNWYRYVEEIIGKQYIPMLQEYCRNMEQDVRFRGSSYGRKLLSELNWLVKYYFMPYLLFNAETGTPPAGRRDGGAPSRNSVRPFVSALRSCRGQYRSRPGSNRQRKKPPAAVLLRG